MILTDFEGQSTEVVEQRVFDECKIVSMDNPKPLRLVTKRFVHKGQIASLWGQRHSSPHKNDGLIIAKNSGKLWTGTCREIFKWKPENTIDVMLEDNNEKIKVSICKDGKKMDITNGFSFEGKTLNTTVVENDLLKCTVDMCKEQNTVMNGIFECSCKISKKELVFFAMKHRPDKPNANDSYTVAATLRNLIENISFDELFADVKDDERTNRSVSFV